RARGAVASRGKFGRPATVLGDRRGGAGVRGQGAVVDLTQRLAGRVAVVTGGGGGIGLASARRLGAEGATVVIADIDERTGTAAADEVGGSFVPVDVSDEASVNSLFDTVVSRHGAVDIAVNNAGISPPDDDLIENTELPAWQR